MIGTEYIERYLYARFDAMKACHVSLYNLFYLAPNAIIMVKIISSLSKYSYPAVFLHNEHLNHTEEANILCHRDSYSLPALARFSSCHSKSRKRLLQVNICSSYRKHSYQNQLI